MVLQALRLIKWLNASEIALLRANRQQFEAYYREKDFPLNKSFPRDQLHEIALVIVYGNVILGIPQMKELVYKYE